MVQRVIPPPPRNRDQNEWVWSEWYRIVFDKINEIATGVISWASISFVGSNLTDLVTRNHNDLNNIQGGSATERYHLSSSISSNVNTMLATTNNIVFPATQAASSNANTLDDYEEGTWAPTVTGATYVGANSSTFSYTKIGRVVTVSIRLQGATSVALAANSTITPPFTADTSGSSTIVSGAGNSSVVYIAPSGNITIPTAVAANANMYCSLTYFAAT